MGEAEAMSIEEPKEGRGTLGKGLIGVAVGGLGGTGLWILRRRRRKNSIAEKAPVATVLRNVPENWREGMSHAVENGSWKPWALTAGGVSLVLFRLMELRQLRRLNRNLVAARV